MAAGVGFGVGVAVSFGVGVAVGFGVGVGVAVGAGVGVAVGSGVGVAVGAGVGSNVVIGSGADVGSDVGAVVGSGVNVSLDSGSDAGSSCAEGAGTSSSVAEVGSCEEGDSLAILSVSDSSFTASIIVSERSSAFTDKAEKNMVRAIRIESMEAANLFMCCDPPVQTQDVVCLAQIIYEKMRP